jgi:hypothetical protein
LRKAETASADRKRILTTGVCCPAGKQTLLFRFLKQHAGYANQIHFFISYLRQDVYNK